MNQLIADNHALQYSCSNEPSNTDFSWKLDLDSIAVIGGIGCLVGDNDSSFVVFIDKNKKIYPINLTSPFFTDSSMLQDFLKKKEIEYDKILNLSINISLVFYPQKIQGVKLFKNTFFHKLKAFFNIEHYAIDHLSEDVSRYIDNIS